MESREFGQNRQENGYKEEEKVFEQTHQGGNKLEKTTRYSSNLMSEVFPCG